VQHTRRTLSNVLPSCLAAVRTFLSKSVKSTLFHSYGFTLYYVVISYKLSPIPANGITYGAVCPEIVTQHVIYCIWENAKRQTSSSKMAIMRLGIQFV